MDSATRDDLLLFLGEYVSEHKRKLFEKVLSMRTRHFALVLEDIFKPHNASAVMRTAEGLGIQDIHVIENENKYVANPYVTRGASKWLNIHHYNEGRDNTFKCLETLKKQGYQIYATSPKEGVSPELIPLDKKVALVFGTEFTGISQTVETLSDGYVNIPMYGFTESYNISVSAAVCMYTVMNRLHKSAADWQLTEEERKEITLDWYRLVAPRAEDLERKFYNQIEEG